MNLHTINDRVYLGISFDLSEFPEMIKSHGNNFKDTLEMENRYASLISKPFTDFSLIKKFIQDVCKWGNYAGVSGKVLKNNDQFKILDAFNKARLILNSKNPDLALALSEINELYGLGTPSFASKHLRFMLPQKCPVYDSILTDVLPYSFDPSGYAIFARDCQNISNELNKRSIENPIRKSITWYVSDVEAAIFSRFYPKNT